MKQEHIKFSFGKDGKEVNEGGLSMEEKVNFFELEY